MRGGRGKGGTIGMLNSVMRGSGKFIATQLKSSNLLPPPALFLPPIPEMKMYNVHVPGESQSKPNIIHLWFIQFVLTFLMLQSYTFKRFLLLHVFFHYTILYLYFLNFLLQVTCLHFSLSPKIFLIFFIFTFLLLATPFLIISFFLLI